MVRNLGGCDTTVSYAWFEDEAVRMGTILLVALEGKGVKKCGLTDVLFFFEAFRLLAAGGELGLIRRVFCCLCGMSGFGRLRLGAIHCMIEALSLIVVLLGM